MKDTRLRVFVFTFVYDDGVSHLMSSSQLPHSFSSDDAKRLERIRTRILCEHERDQKELRKWQKEKARPQKKTYLWYLMFVLTLVYIVDEVATNLNSTVQPYMVLEFFVLDLSMESAAAQTLWQQWSLLALAGSLLVLLYRPLADRFGRKLFLVVNTFALALGMLLCFWSPVFPVYLFGFFFLTFMTGPDMQVVYITECAPSAYRATFVSVIKGISQLGIALIALGMDAFMKENAAAWRWVFLIPAIVGFIVAFIALFSARETDQFLDERIAYLSQSDEEKIAALTNKKAGAGQPQGGLIATLRFGFHHHQLKWLFIASMIYTTAFYGTAYYGQIIDDAGYLPSQLAQVALIWPFVCSFITIVYGLFSDRIGRKSVSLVLGCFVLLGLAMLSCALLWGWGEIAVGVFLGVFLAGYWNWGDTLILMVSESAPTNLRSSAAGSQSLFAVVGYLFGLAAVMLFTSLAPAGALVYLDFVFLGLAIPGVVGALAIVLKCVGETKGRDLTILRGDEWDHPRG